MHYNKNILWMFLIKKRRMVFFWDFSKHSNGNVICLKLSKFSNDRTKYLTALHAWRLRLKFDFGLFLHNSPPFLNSFFSNVENLFILHGICIFIRCEIIFFHSRNNLVFFGCCKVTFVNDKFLKEKKFHFKLVLNWNWLIYLFFVRFALESIRLC